MNREAWEKALQAELKITDVNPKLTKKSVEGIFDILATQPRGQVIPNQTPWKKASQTYIIADAAFESSLKDDLAHGVRLFFFAPSFDLQILARAKEVLKSHADAKDIEVIELGEKSESRISALEIAKGGGTHLQELSLLTLRLIEWAQARPTAKSLEVLISVDNHYFQSIAKIRALREIANRVFSELNRSVSLRLISTVNLREWTLYDSYNNLLRNSASVAAALVGGADAIQTLGYTTPFEIEATVDAENLERSRRMARNTTHILSLESMLGMVQDAAAGSFHLESLTEHFCSESWKAMQQWIQCSHAEQDAHFEKEVAATRAERTKQFNRRQLVLSGVNEYPNVKEQLNLKAPLKGTGFRVAREFEQLRLQVESMAKKPVVRILFWGDYAALNARLNFTKNYFELLGLEVLEPGHSVQDEAAFTAWMKQGNVNEIHVLCAKDEEYPQLVSWLGAQGRSNLANYVAGKVSLEGFDSIFGGQDVYPVLEKLVQGMKS